MSTAAVVNRLGPIEGTSANNNKTIAYQPGPSASLLPTIDLSAPETAYDTLSKAASTTGAALLTNLPIRPPIAAIQRLFTTLYTNPALASRLNATYPQRGVFKAACLAPSANPAVDQKTTIDLSVRRLQKLAELDPALVADLGQDFVDVLDFYAVVERDVLPLLMTATSRIAGLDLAPMHAEANNNLRLIDYFQQEQDADEDKGPRCGSHRDYGTFTVVFQDRAVGGLEFDPDDNGSWIQVPAAVDAVVSWGWCGAILSDNRARAAKHRVLKTRPAGSRRTTAVVFVAPDMDVVLKPMVPNIGGGSGRTKWRDEILNGDITVREFKPQISKRWRRREGNEAGEVVEGAQDKEVMEFLMAGRG